MEGFRLGEAVRQEIKAAHSAGRMRAEMAEHAQRTPVNLANHGDLRAHLLSAHDWEPSDFWRNSHEHRHPVLGAAPQEDHELTHQQLRDVHDRHDHVHYRSDFPGAVTLGHDHFHE